MINGKRVTLMIKDMGHPPLSRSPPVWALDISLGSKDHNNGRSTTSMGRQYLTIQTSNTAKILAIKASLASKYKMKGPGPARIFIGIEFTKEKYMDEILNKFGMNNCNGVHTLLEPNIKFAATDPI